MTLGDKETKLNGELTGFDRVQYLFTANPGQHLKIQLDTSNHSNYINVRAAGAAEAVCQGSLTGKSARFDRSLRRSMSSTSS